MTKQELGLLFRMECRQHGIKVGMRWATFKNHKILATYNPYQHVIKLTDQLLNLDYATVMWVIRHEIAHALDYLGLDEQDWYCTDEAAHGDRWKSYCKVVGCPATQFVAA